MSEPNTPERQMDEAVYRALLDAHAGMHGTPALEIKRYLWTLAQVARVNMGLRVEASEPDLAEGARVKGDLHISRMVTPWQVE